jgi:Flp pilus assembly pilin Flp
MRNFFKKSESGATLVEYGVALVLAIIVGGVALQNLGENTSAQMDRACGAFATTGDSAADNPECGDASAGTGTGTN